MLKKEKLYLKNKNRQVNTPAILANKQLPIFGEQKKNIQNNRPKSKNIINYKPKHKTDFDFYVKKNNNNPKPINLLHNNNNIMNININRKNKQFKKEIFSEQKEINKKIFFLNRPDDNKKFQINKINLSNNNLPKYQLKKNNNPNNQNLMNKLMEDHDSNKNKIILQNKMNVIKIEGNKNKNLKDIFPKIKKVPKIKELDIKLNGENKLNILPKNNDLKMILNANNNQNKKFKAALPNNNKNNNKNNIININNNNNQNMNKNLRYILKGKPIKKEENEIKNVSNNIFNNNKQNKFVFKLNINNNINNFIINKPINIGKSNDHYLLKKNNNILGNRNIRLQKNDLNKLNLKIHSLNEEKISNTSSENIIHLKDYFCREEINSKINDQMEDFILIKHPFMSIENHNLSLFGIFDGHGGDFVSKYLKENFAPNLEKNIKKNNSLNFRSILKTAIESIDKDLEKFGEAENCGSTGTVVIVNNNSVYCANIGDSKCFYISKNNVVQLSEDHNCSNQKEKEELKKKGIKIFQNRVFGCLALTRTFGDNELKKDGVGCEPSIKKIFLDKNNVKFIIIASDGIWDVVNEEKLWEMYNGLTIGTSEEFCNKLVDFAMNNGSNDNISCIVLSF